MSYWVEVAADGTLLQYTVSPDEPRSMLGGTVHQVPEPVDVGCSIYVDDGIMVLGPRPSPNHWIDATSRSWVSTETTAARIRAIQDRLQEVMDSAARALGYDDIKTAITYADEPAVAKFQAEGQAFRTWRSLVWAACYAHPAMTGQAPIPTPDEAEALMPAMPPIAYP